MDFSTILIILVVFYFLFYIISLCIFDCDLGVKWAEKFGNSIGTLRHKVVWITGASSGIGEHLAITLARHDVRLVLSARRTQELERVKALCLGASKNLSSNDVLILELDITNCESHNDSFQKVIEHFGTLDILVNNAGRSQRAVWEDIDLSVDQQMFDLNVFGVISLTRIAVKYFLQRGEGHVAATSSVAGVIGVPFSGSYTATKWALHGYLNSLRAEKLGTNLKITIFCPGPTFTNFLAESFTGNIGEKYGQSVTATDRRMTGERCGELFAIALANQLPETWVAVYPIVLLCYVMVYYPNIAKLIAKRMGSKQFLKLRDSKNSMSPTE